MAALFDNAAHSDSALAETLPPCAPSVIAALAYSTRCLRGHRPFGVITGTGVDLANLLERLTADCQARDDLHLIRVASPTDSVQVFLSDCLAQLGFELLQAALDDLHNLLIVFLRHESARGRRTVAIIESTEQFGPRVLEFMQTLVKVRGGTTPAMTFVLTGSSKLHRILDSPGMAGHQQFTRERFDLDRSLMSVVPAAALPGVNGPGSTARLLGQRAEVTTVQKRSLIVMLDGKIVERRELVPGRVLIGRSPSSNLRLNSRYVSRHHAALVVTLDKVLVVDLQSTNATLVNGQETASQKLEHGDILAIGNFRVRFDSRVQVTPG
ncbi:MAG: FHA domain-containing protein [Gammaproteobacteria bacterium]